jgi:hypothetical protein
VDVQDVKASYRHHGQQMGGKHRVSDWCEDSLILLDTMCALVPASKAAWVRREGTKHFLRGNYRRARNIRPLSSRLDAYGTVLKYFDYRVLQFISIVISFAVSRRKNLMKTKIKELLERAPSLKLRIDWFRRHVRGSLG